MLFNEIVKPQPQLDHLAIYKLGDCPNIEFPTMGGEVWWKTLESKNGLRLQQNHVTQLCRILNQDDHRVAWGSPVAMKDKFRRLTRPNFLEKGDIIGVTRANIYDHYAVYIGDDRVIHYAGEGNDFGGKISIHEAPIEEFLKMQRQFFVLHFFEDGQMPIKIQSSTSFSLQDAVVQNEISLKRMAAYHLYSAEETIQRARARVGENSYNLVGNNCEHFAIWCKTGVHESHQVRRVIKNLFQARPPIRF